MPGRRLREVNRAALENAIQQAEKDGPLPNLDALWKKTVAFYNAGNVPEPITFSVVALRAKAWGLQTKTQPGKKGRKGGEGLRAWKENGGKRLSRKEKFKNNPDVQQCLSELRAEIGAIAEKTPSGEIVYPAKRFLPLVDAMARGSRSAAVKLHCLGCSGWGTAEVKHCAVLGCPLWPFRPYQKSANGEAEETEEADTEEADTEDTDTDTEDTDTNEIDTKVA